MLHLQGLIFNIQRFSIHDGPGIRTTAFFKGCNLRCFWCHNPESLSPSQDLQFFEKKCMGCGACFKACPTGAHQTKDGAHRIDRERCTCCGACAGVCPTEALSIAGKNYSVDELVKQLMQDKPFYETSGGGITLSGGEALLQADFALEVLKVCKENGVHTAVDTAGLVPWASIQSVLPYTDLFLYDIKAFDPATHKAATRADNRLILKNLQKLGETGANIWVRMPVIPNTNDSEQNIRAIAQFIKPIQGISKVELLPFHRLGSGKYTSLSLSYGANDLNPPSDETMERLLDILLQNGLPGQKG